MTTTDTGNGVEKGRRSGGSRVPPGESKEEAFMRLAIYRISEAQDVTGRVIKLAVRPYTDEQAAKVIAAYETMLADVKAAYSKKAKAAGFSF